MAERLGRTTWLPDLTIFSYNMTWLPAVGQVARPALGRAPAVKYCRPHGRSCASCSADDELAIEDPPTWVTSCHLLKAGLLNAVVVFVFVTLLVCGDFKLIRTALERRKRDRLSRDDHCNDDEPDRSILHLQP